MVTAGILAGIAVSGPAAQATAGLMANPSSQRFYVNEQHIDLEAYEIGGSNYVKLRDIGETAGFGVTYDSATNTVHISLDKPYEPGVIYPAIPSALSKNADGSINIPQDGSQYVPQVGDVIRCDDGTNYTIMDVSRYDKNCFADGPVGPLPTATCDWSQFDQPELPKAEVKRFNDSDGDYIFIRNLYETRRMLYSLYNAMGEDEWIMQSGSVGPHPSDPAGRPDWRALLALAGGDSPGNAALLPRRRLLPGGLGRVQKRQIPENRIQPALIKIRCPPEKKSLR